MSHLSSDYNALSLQVTIVTVGVMIRSIGAGVSISTGDGVARGVAFTVASAALYSLLGVLYERLITIRGTPLNHTQVIIQGKAV